MMVVWARLSRAKASTFQSSRQLDLFKPYPSTTCQPPPKTSSSWSRMRTLSYYSYPLQIRSSSIKPSTINKTIVSMSNSLSLWVEPSTNSRSARMSPWPPVPFTHSITSLRVVWSVCRPVGGHITRQKASNRGSCQLVNGRKSLGHMADTTRAPDLRIVLISTRKATKRRACSNFWRCHLARYHHR